MANRKVYIVGRKNHTKPCDISVPEDQDAVSRQHLEITDTGGRDFLVVDISGQNGTEIWENGDWVPINQGNVRRDTPLRLGQQYQTSHRKIRLPHRLNRNLRPSLHLLHGRVVVHTWIQKREKLFGDE